MIADDALPPSHSASSSLHGFISKNLKWNNNQEIARILYAAPHHADWISHQVFELAPNGSQQIFARYDGNWFKNDKYMWKKRRDGRLIREDHMKLKVNKQELISANYTHSAIVPTFHRRVYWLTANPHYVLVHYLNSSEEGFRDLSVIADKIVTTMRTSQIRISRASLHDHLRSIFSERLDQTQIDMLLDMVCHALDSAANQPSTSQSHLERRNSCSSAFRKGLSSMALRRQPSTFSDSVDANYIGVVVKNCGADGSNGTFSQPADNRSHSGETQRSSNQDEEMSLIHPHSLSARSASAGAASSQASYVPDTSGGTNVTQIFIISPSAGNVKGGLVVLVVGEWYLKGHEYSVLFGERKVAANLIRPGVLSVNLPPATSPGPVAVRVLCNGCIASNASQFVYEDNEKEGILQLLVDRLHLLIASFAAVGEIKPLASLPYNEESVISVVSSLQNLRLVHPALLATIPSLPSRTLLHLCASLDYSTATQKILNWRRVLPYTRELDPLARDCEGRTALHLAALSGNVSTSRVLVDCCPQAIFVLDDRGRTPSDLATAEVLPLLESASSDQDDVLNNATGNERVEHVTSTELWVMTNGETVTDKHLLNDRRRMDDDSSSSSYMQADDGDRPSTNGTCFQNIPPPLHVEISMDTDVHVPDSPKMADLFQAVTSPGVMINDNARQKMASLAKQIIDALPDRIKHDPTTLMDEESFAPEHAGHVFSYPDNLSRMLSSTDVNNYYAWSHSTIPGYGMSTESDVVSSVNGGIAPGTSFDQHLCANEESVASSRANTCESNSFDFDKDLGEFFNVNVDGDVDPTIQQRLDDLKLSDGEQREVYEAAMVIQRAYREYRERNTNRRQADVERRAAVTIQCCYRRYKQFCYFKKLHSAAIVVQKHFRLKKVNQKESHAATDNEVQEHPTLEDKILRIQVPQNSSSLLREHRAAATIQAAYRGHRKRQAAARKIQKFMRESKMKLRKMAVQNEDATCVDTRHQTPDGRSMLLNSQRSATDIDGR